MRPHSDANSDKKTGKTNNPTLSDQPSFSDHVQKEASETELPGYPHYPAGEDIMNPGNGFKKAGTDIEGLANSKRLSAADTSKTNTEQPDTDQEETDDLEIVEGTEADVTADDLIALGEKDQDSDMGEDELIGKQSRVDESEDLQDDELDIPGTELDDKAEEIGEEDEENNYYSLGGDRHENQEEDPS